LVGTLGATPSAADLFVFRLVQLVSSAGGTVTIDKNHGTGTLIDVIEVLRPHLAPGSLPVSFSLSRLQRLKTAATRAPLDKISL
jgi:hypothetical protein